MSDSAHADEHGHHGLGHVVPPKVLLGVFGILLFFTVVTVLVTKVDLGPGWNLFVAMVIAGIKATFVCLYFMHLRYDKLMHTIALVSALVFFILFAGLCLMDSSQYQQQVRWNQSTSNIF